MRVGTRPVAADGMLLPSESRRSLEAASAFLASGCRWFPFWPNEVTALYSSASFSSGYHFQILALVFDSRL